MIEDLLDSARIITGKLRIEVEPVDLVPALEAALDAVRPAAEAKGVETDRQFRPAAGTMLGDADRLQQVVWNLLSNAVKFTPEGGRVELRMEGAADHVRITVSDTGKGIEPDFCPSSSTASARPTRRARGGSAGWGWAVAGQTSGRVARRDDQAASEGAGRGATFTVTLPTPPAGIIAPPPPAVAIARSAHGRRHPARRGSVARGRERACGGRSGGGAPDFDSGARRIRGAGDSRVFRRGGAGVLSDPPGGRRPTP